MPVSRRASSVLFLLLALAAFAPAALRGQKTAPSGFSLPERPGTRVDGGREAGFLPALPEAPSVHAASLVALPGGRLLAAWYGGSREGAKDVAIYQSMFERGAWGAARRVTTPAATRAEVRRYVRKLGNPVLCRDGRGRLHLFYVSVSVGGWSGSALNHKVSADEGTTWGPAKRIVTSPFLNAGTLVKGAPVLFEDGSIAVPAYHEFLGKFPELLRIGLDGGVLSKVRLHYGRESLQPSLALRDARRVLAFLRHSGDGPRRVMLTESRDGGQHWTAPEYLPLPNPDAAVSALRLDDGTLLLAYNPSENDRRALALAASPDGRTWRPILTLERDENPRSEYSYPFLAASGGRVHLVYTWNRQRIRHVSFPEGRIGERMK